MKILGIETSCDETGVAVYDTDRQCIIADQLYSQVDLHAAYGGVVPELASRDHIRRLPLLFRAALSQAGIDVKALDAIGYTAGPGLAGALLVGAAFARALGFGLQKPVLAIHHLEGHLLSPLLTAAPPDFPFIALLVSGGHTQLMRVDAFGSYLLLGETLDDAAGEAFDKTAKLLGLGYPGGPAIAASALQGDAGRFDLPRPMLNSGMLDFSFSGLKTAVLHTVSGENWRVEDTADLAASFQQAAVDVLSAKAFMALRRTGLKRLLVAGGVGANRALRGKLDTMAALEGIQVYYPEVRLCTDNGAMIAFAAAMRLMSGQGGDGSNAIQIKPRWPLAELMRPGN